MNMNELAKEIAEREGLKKSLPIGQIKEVLRCLVQLLAEDFSALKAFVGYLFKEVEKP